MRLRRVDQVISSVSDGRNDRSVSLATQEPWRGDRPLSAGFHAASPSFRPPCRRTPRVVRCRNIRSITGELVMRLRTPFLVATAFASALIAGAAAAQDKPPIRIGEINSYTGPAAAFTLSYRDGINMAVDEINASGGVLGRKLEILFRDDNFSPADAVRLASELVLNQKVDLLAGTFLSPIALAVANYAQQKKVLFVAAEALTNQLTWEKGSRYVFRIRNPMYMLTKMLVSKAEQMKCKRWAGLG